MSVLLETSLGDLVIDLDVENCPKTCENFLKLCKIYYYNLNAFFNGAPHYPGRISTAMLTRGVSFTVSKDFLAQIGDPTATGTGGESIWSILAAGSSSNSPASRYFPPEILPKLKHTNRGTVSMAVAPGLDGQQGGCGSQFFITHSPQPHLDGRYTVFGHVVAGMDVVDRLMQGDQIRTVRVWDGVAWIGPSSPR